jgi:hypothetical protein
MGRRVKAFTIWQSWCSLIIAGVKPYEFRPGSFRNHRMYLNGPQIGERVALHAAARKMRRDELQDILLRLESGSTGLKPEARPIVERALMSPGLFPLSAILGTAVIGEPRHASKLFGGTQDSDRPSMSNWAWPMLDIIKFEPPIPQKGAQGFWRWDAAADARAQP